MIYLRHPIHGNKIATLDIEAAHDEEHGWTRYDPKEKVSGLESPAAYANNMEVKRRGRPARSAE